MGRGRRRDGSSRPASWEGPSRPRRDDAVPAAVHRLGDGGGQPVLRPRRGQSYVGALLRARFVHPLDGFNESNPPSHPELLHRLAQEFASSGFDLKHMARCITTSKAYQRTSRPLPGNQADASFSHMTLKVLTPEVVYDSLSVVMTSDMNDRAGPAPTKWKKFFGPLGQSREQFVLSFRTGEERTLSITSRASPSTCG